MNVVGHQAPSQNARLMANGVFSQHLKVPDPILIGEENVLAIVAALRDVMWHSG
jgi:hypothetical protein